MIFTAFKKTLHLIKQHKLLFLALFFTQLLFIIVFALLQVKYQMAVVENLNEVMAPLESADLDSLMFQDVSPILDSWEQLKTNAQSLFFFSFLAFAVICGFNWSLTHYLIKKQNLFKLWGKFIALALLFFAVYSLIIAIIFKTVLFYENPIAAAQIMAVLAGLFAYFALLAFSLTPLKFKEIFKKTFWQIGLKKFYWVLLVYLIVAAVLSVIGYLLYCSVNFWPAGLMAVFIILLILALNTGRIFLINSVSELA